MIDQLEALRAVQETGSTAKAAVRLRITQSAVSKRIAALEALAGAVLLERAGRGCRLTPAAERLLKDAVPLLARLQDVVANAAAGTERGPQLVRVAAAESLLASWLPEILARVQAAQPTLRLELHAHRGPALVARVLSGDADVAIGASPPGEEGLVVQDLGEEPLVLVPSRLKPLRAKDGDVVECWTIEERSLTWPSLRHRLRARNRPWGLDLRVTGRLESFTALARCAEAGLAHALVPRAIALGSGIPARVLVPLPGLTRTIALMSRRTALQREPVAAFAKGLRAAWPPPDPQQGTSR